MSHPGTGSSWCHQRWGGGLAARQIVLARRNFVLLPSETRSYWRRGLALHPLQRQSRPVPLQGLGSGTRLHPCMVCCRRWVFESCWCPERGQSASICCQPQQPRIKRVETHLGEKKKKEGMNGDTERLKENNLGCMAMHMDWRERQ